MSEPTEAYKRLTQYMHLTGWLSPAELGTPEVANWIQWFSGSTVTVPETIQRNSPTWALAIHTIAQFDGIPPAAVEDLLEVKPDADRETYMPGPHHGTSLNPHHRDVLAGNHRRRADGLNQGCRRRDHPHLGQCHHPR